MLSVDAAVLQLRADPQMADLVRDSYLDRDVLAAGKRFVDSAEFAEVRQRLGDHWRNGIVVDLGAGTGIASYAFAQSGAQKVYAVEPDPSEEVGRGAIMRCPKIYRLRLSERLVKKSRCHIPAWMSSIRGRFSTTFRI